MLINREEGEEDRLKPFDDSKREEDPFNVAVSMI